MLTARGISSERDLPLGLVTRLFEPVVAELGEAGAVCVPGAAESPSSGPAGAASSAELRALHEALARLAAGAPVLVAVDDLPCIDRQSLRWLSALPQRVEHARIAVLVTACLGEPCSDPALLDELLAMSAAELRPSELDPPATAALIERALTTAPEAPFVAAVMREAGGNPLLVTELAAALRDREVTPTSGAAAGLGEVPVPGLASRIRARLRRISPHALGVAGAVAVLGAEADPARIAGLCGSEPPVSRPVRRSARGPTRPCWPPSAAAGRGRRRPVPAGRRATTSQPAPARRPVTTARSPPAGSSPARPGSPSPRPRGARRRTTG